MGVTIESSVWEPSPFLYIFIFLSCFFSIFLLPSKSSSSSSSSLFDHSNSSSFIPFQRNFLLLFSLASVMEGLWSVFGEYELVYYGVAKEQMMLLLCAGFSAALFVGSFLGMISDLIGQKKVCLIFFILHLFVGVWKSITAHPSVWVANICLSLASSIFSFNFETWVAIEHEKQGQRQDILSDTFWLMTFFESASLIGGQVLANWLVGIDVKKGVVPSSTASVFLSILGIICVSRGWTENPKMAFDDYRTSFFTYIFGDKRIWLLVLAQACLQFSIALFWILWAPTLVADGREVHLGLIFPSLLGARMLGSTVFPWLISGPSSFRTEDCLLYAFVVLGFVFSIIAYDYQEIGILVALFCLFHACVGLILPSLARLRTMYVPNELRGGMISLSLAPANAAILLFLLLVRVSD
ncbi:Major facilitator superfamily domain-containing protein 5 [Citrus sinensis]|uniref:Major facilitator superfamily domain-containing protein 5 n=1 Tax=Citrus sinensis TaxID=2711 RepID=A0ACB8J3C0_CITSI|nr:Major facilitator superfamily domain-containing protein 5 [Citrus sinensis]